MGFRWRMALSAVASLLLIASCGGGGSKSANLNTSQPSVPTTSLPLQSSGLAVGGDVQSRATDVLKRGITKEQAQRIADACGPAAEIANGPDDCAKTIIEIIVNSLPSCEAHLCISAFDVSKLREVGYDGYVEITDNRPGKSLCDTAPGNVCLRVAVATSALLDQVVAATLPATTSSAVTTSSEVTTSTETETTATSSSDTSSSTPEATSAPTASS